MHPEKRFYKASQQPTSYVSIHPTLTEDLYVVLAGTTPTRARRSSGLHQPAGAWVWVGGVVMFLGTLLALVPSRVEREMAEIRQAQELAVQAGESY